MGPATMYWQRELASNRSTRMGVLAGLALVSMAIGLLLAGAFGGWMVLPFIGLEMAAVLAAFLWIERSAQDRDVFEWDSLHLMVRRHRGGKITNHRFDRAWVSISLESSQGLWLRQSGKCVQVGEYLHPSRQREMLGSLRACLTSAR